MSKTGLVWLLFYLAGCVATLFNPLYGLMTYMFAYYTNPPLHWWSEGLPAIRWSFTISVILAISYFIHRAGRHSLGFFAHKQSKWLLLLVLIAYAVTPIAVDRTMSLDEATKLAKALALYFLMAQMISSPKTFRWLVAAHILGGLYWGIEAFMDPETEAGRLINVGGPDTDTGNSTAAHINTILPFAGFWFLSGTKWEKRLALVAAPFLVYTFELLNSRGAMLGLAVAFVATLWWGWRRWGGKLLMAGGVAALALAIVAGPKFIERQASTFKPEDHSALSRLDFWAAALELMQDRPLGAGGMGFDLLSPQYLPEEVVRKDYRLITAHNTYLLCGSEWGWAGMFVFCMFLFATFRQLRDLMTRKAKTEVQRRIQVDALACAAALVGVCVAGMFGNRLYGEAMYWLAAMSAGMANIWARDEREQEEQDEVVEVEAKPRLVVAGG
jgi:hypothetical protein